MQRSSWGLGLFTYSIIYIEDAYGGHLFQVSFSGWDKKVTISYSYIVETRQHHLLFCL